MPVNRTKLIVGGLFVASFLAAFGLLLRRSLKGNGSLKSLDLAVETLAADQSPTPKTLKAIITDRPLTVLNFWASWCPSCRAESPNLHALYETFKDRGQDIQFVSIASADDRYAALQSDKFRASAYEQYFDIKNSQVSAANGVNQLPQTFLVDSTGKILLRKWGSMTDDYLKKWQTAISYRLRPEATK